MIRAIKCGMGRILSSPAFAISVLVTFLLCLTEDVYIDVGTMQAYSVLESLSRFDRGFMRGNTMFCSLSVFEKALSGYSAMFLPIVASVAFVYAQNGERNSGNIRFLIFREGRYKFYASKFICAVLGGGLCVTLGVALFGIFSFITFPAPSEYAVYSPEMYSSADLFKEIAQKLFSSFIYACANTGFAFFLSSFCRNRYIILCVPFLARFIQDTVAKKMIAGTDESAIEKIVLPFMTFAPSQIPYLEPGWRLYSTIAVLVMYIAAMYFGYVIIMERRVDKGG